MYLTTLLQEDEDDPFIYPEKVDAMLNKTMALRIKMQDTFDNISVQRLSLERDYIKKIRDKVGIDEVNICNTCYLVKEIIDLT